MTLPSAIGVVGAGTMGAGIAQLGVLAGIDTFLHDPFAEALERGGDSVHRGLAKGVERERWTQDEAEAAERRLVLASEIDELAGCGLVIEAVPERAELKRELFARLSQVCGEETVLATNTSSILVSSLATAAARPENVVGMHFFNPPPLMRLLELIAAAQTSDHALEVARAVGEAMGKTTIVAADGPGFLVNRCGRPFSGEAYRLLQERVATHEQIDRICRLGGGFRMGPFELSDLVGIDVGYEVAQSFDVQSFGEPRWKPSMLQARKVAAGQLGRKTGAGWYEYGDDGSYRPQDPEPLEPGGGDGRRVTVSGSGTLAGELRERAVAAGFEVTDGADLAIDASLEGSGASAVLCAARPLRGRAATGFHLLPPLEHCRLVELTGERDDEVERFFRACGFHAEWVEDAPGLVLGRIVCQLVNEAAFAIGEGVGAAEDVDTGVTLGLNHPRGPVEWGAAIGLDRVLATVDGLFAELRDPRYRAAPLLRRGRI